MLKPLCVFLMISGAAIADDYTSANRTSSPVLQGAPNFRDIGGYRTTDGMQVRRGAVFRSNDLSQLTPADAAKVDSLHLAAVIDLRTEDERKQSPSVWLHAPTDLYESPKTSLAPILHMILNEAGTTEGARRGMMSFYTQMPGDYRAEYAVMFHRIAAGDLPILVHCTAGKDRTGVAVAVLLASVGVAKQTVIDDYELTEHLLPAPGTAAMPAVQVGPAAQAHAALAELPNDSRRALWRADPDYIRAALDSIDSEYGSIDGYLRRGLGLSRADIREVRKAIVE